MSKAKSRGKFITFEGGEGAGKSSQVVRLSSALRRVGLDCVSTREPGGSPGAEQIRKLLVDGDVDRWSPISEALLMYAARRDHIERLIEPALSDGRWVLCDRFADSSMAYQGAAGDIGEAAVGALDQLVLNDLQPDLTIILDLPPEVGLQRAGERGGGRRFEAKGLRFHSDVQAAFRAIAERHSERCVLLDAARPLDEIAGEIASIVERRFGVSLAL